MEIEEKKKDESVTLFDLMLVWDYEPDQSNLLQYTAGVLVEILKFDDILATRMVMEASSSGRTLVFTSHDKNEVVELRNKLSAFSLLSQIVPVEIK